MQDGTGIDSKSHPRLISCVRDDFCTRVRCEPRTFCKHANHANNTCAVLLNALLGRELDHLKSPPEMWLGLIDNLIDTAILRVFPAIFGNRTVSWEDTVTMQVQINSVVAEEEAPCTRASYACTGSFLKRAPKNL